MVWVGKDIPESNDKLASCFYDYQTLVILDINPTTTNLFTHDLHNQ